MYNNNGRIHRSSSITSITCSGTGYTKKWLRKRNESHICNYKWALACYLYNCYNLYQTYKIQTMQLWSELDRYALSIWANLRAFLHLFLAQLHFWRRICGDIVCYKLLLPVHQCSNHGHYDILHIWAKTIIILIFSRRSGDICKERKGWYYQLKMVQCFNNLTSPNDRFQQY